MHAVGVLPGKKHLSRRAGQHAELASHRDGVAETSLTLRRGYTDPVVALSAEQLGRLPGDVSQPGEDWPCRRQQPVLAGGRRQLREPWSQHEPALQVAGDQPVVFQATASRCAVGRASPVAATSPAKVAGPGSRAERTRAALSSTPTPLVLSTPRYCRLIW